MKLYSYVVARDFGFAPNPFFGFCTLATCKPKIRKHASVGDWVIGTGAKTRYGYQGKLIYAMQVSDVLDFDTYWNDERFHQKRPNLMGSLAMLYGDNIYHKEGACWIQENSHHSSEKGRTNYANRKWDTSVDRLLVSTKFVYWGRAAPVIPDRFRSFGKLSIDVCAGRGHRVFDDNALVTAFEEWVGEKKAWGVQGDPLEFARHKPTSLVVTKTTAPHATTGRSVR